MLYATKLSIMNVNKLNKSSFLKINSKTILILEPYSYYLDIFHERLRRKYLVMFVLLRGYEWTSTIFKLLVTKINQLQICDWFDSISPQMQICL